MTIADRSVQYLRDLLAFFGTQFKIVPAEVEEGETTGELIVSCVGVGYSNVNKSTA